VSHTYSNLLTHVIFSTKGRLPLMDDELRPRLFAYLGGIVRELRGTALTIGGVPDHVHLFLVLPASLAVSDAMRIVKSNSSGWVHDTFPGKADFAWQTGFGAFSVSRSNADAVGRYIESQEEHHKKYSFQQEFIEFLNRHEVPYDERYVWD